MKRRLTLFAAMIFASVSLTGCVKIIDKGTESQYTGVEEFDASADSSSTWAPIVEEIQGNAKELTEIIGSIDKNAVAVKGSAEVAEFESKANGKKNALILKVDGANVKIQIGSIYSGTDVRDVQTLKEFGSFTNQTEWSEYAKALNAELDAQVVSPLGLDESVVGKTVTFVGAASASGDEVTITPVEMSVE